MTRARPHACGLAGCTQNDRNPAVDGTDGGLGASGSWPCRDHPVTAAQQVLVLQGLPGARRTRDHTPKGGTRG